MPFSWAWLAAFPFYFQMIPQEKAPKEAAMSKLFSPYTLTGMELKNRFVRSATWEGMADGEGRVTPQLIECMTNLAEGGVGLIISGHAYVHPMGKAGMLQMGAYSDEMLPGLTQMADAVHAAGSKILLQLAHAGACAAADEIGETPRGPSDIKVEGDRPVEARAMTLAEIAEFVEAFAAAAGRAKQAGFDGVQLHGAHGYCMSQFLSPFFNKREDAYGGSIENRSRLLLEVLQAVRETVGRDYPVHIKLNCEDFHEGGMSVEDMLHVAHMLKENGIDGLEMSGGTILSGILSPVRVLKKDRDFEDVFYLEQARRLKAEVDLPLVLVGGIRSDSVMEELVEEGVADCISLCRPLIREPDLVKRLQSGETERSACISCNLCFGPAMKGEGIYCVPARKAAGASKA
jgi:2,4-dienoyl-CoA reductase-like NADH-dependent reductase (Old Yellow Enzyme family)